MNERLAALLELTRSLKHDPARIEIDWSETLRPDPNDSRCARAARCFRAMLAEEARRVRILPGERIAQLVITPYITAAFEEKEALSETVRGQGGFGSTGKM